MGNKSSSSDDVRSSLPPYSRSRYVQPSLPPHSRSRYVQSSLPPLSRSRYVQSSLPPLSRSHDVQSSLPQLSRSHDVQPSLPQLSRSHDFQPSLPQLSRSHDFQSSPPTFSSSDAAQPSPPQERSSGILKYKRMMDWDFKTTSVGDINNEMAIPKVKRIVADRLHVAYDNIDIVQNSTIKASDDIVMLDKDIEVIVHPKNRTLPSELRTSEPDCLTGYTDEPTVLLTCTHATTPDMLYGSCLSQLNDGKSSLTCPVSSCGAKLEFAEVMQKACLSEDEKLFFERRINQNVVGKVRTCPNCASYCERIDKNNRRVQCFYCNKKGESSSEFCWDCGLCWVKDHTCPDPKEQIQCQLQNCERITMEYNGMKNVPKLRACPKCSLIIEHAGGCKTMTCEYCKQIFCFCCLKLAVNGKLPCGNHSVACSLAPIQNIRQITSVPPQQ